MAEEARVIAEKVGADTGAPTGESDDIDRLFLTESRVKRKVSSQGIDPPSSETVEEKYPMLSLDSGSDNSPGSTDSESRRKRKRKRRKRKHRSSSKRRKKQKKAKKQKRKKESEFEEDVSIEHSAS